MKLPESVGIYRKFDILIIIYVIMGFLIIMQEVILSVIGLGKLGLPTALAFAKAGFKVFGYEIDRIRADKIKKGISPIVEPGVQEYLNRYGNNLHIVDSIKEAVDNSDVTFIIVPTPSDEDGTFSLKFVMPVIDEIGKSLKSKKSFHITVVVSTITPSSMERYIKPRLEELSGKKCGIDFGLCYNPEFVALGSVLKDFENPDFNLIGESDKKSGDILESIYRKVCKSSPHIARMNFINAELVKLALNTYVTTKITYANMLARICEKLEGADIDVVTGALGLDTRVGSKYLKGGLGYGGPCFPRDNRALSSFAKKLGINTKLPDMVDEVNREQPKYVVQVIKNYLTDYKSAVGIMGITYKSGTDVTEESQGLKIAQLLNYEGYNCFTFDTVEPLNLPTDIKYIRDFDEFFGKVKVIVVSVASAHFKNLIENALNKYSGENKVIIDCWRYLKDINFPSHIKYIRLGVGRAQ